MCLIRCVVEGHTSLMNYTKSSHLQMIVINLSLCSFLDIQGNDGDVNTISVHCRCTSLLIEACPRPTNGISDEFEIRSKFVVLLFKICSTNHNKILHMLRQLHCREELDQNVVSGTGPDDE